MNDITGKRTTLRYAEAEGYVYCHPNTIERVKANNLPKGDLFGVAKAAALLGSKKTAELIPHCHPVPIDSFSISFEILESKNAIRIQTQAKSIGKTGIEMEALTGVTVAALVIYDLLKPIDKEIEISSVKLLEKKGGKTDSQISKFASGSNAKILVCSDSCFAGKKEDGSGKVIAELLKAEGVDVLEIQIVPDEPTEIQKVISTWSSEKIDLIVTTGGTGLGPRDNTTDTIKQMLEQEIPGIAEVMRSFGQDRTPFAMLSRSLAGRIGKSLIVAVPGSSNGAKESMTAILPAIFHAKKMMRGEGH
ncbi:bifunctional molybdenum cofactor biosynthesis protein MoaC/MoaB [Leptospira bourretii]|uniref:Molybdopterin adenylyltransferase n=1 Tax=Leptospira bourretii TaxID=2484962 RepID=A0A4V3JKX7_9LEPT|nr:bifunctional molybdenum cofactor biosynthesis protein MoaC/MoaB [Leptospira bourretii]TGK88013.1 bifunctional molybdenum cofactor biosynthesis protein MoaC/MoaB [Leptospira bourretii]TGK88663.1 bifunctional molybdenum cofactor biosynthesis protein MoaC/MoaB [Leptospira bourretii]TGL20500.1 bifunctional molybdenum cofactor biosynthesis protein MoaC/MoaB [Leptospira bourretii]TGL38019.1 bifunctional molybdenum cofactor biosynthesis protein MoaC/MoaB [Leptospira bourretii]